MLNDRPLIETGDVVGFGSIALVQLVESLLLAVSTTYSTILSPVVSQDNVPLKLFWFTFPSVNVRLEIVGKAGFELCSVTVFASLSLYSSISKPNQLVSLSDKPGLVYANFIFPLIISDVKRESLLSFILTFKMELSLLSKTIVSKIFIEVPLLVKASDPRTPAPCKSWWWVMTNSFNQVSP